MHTIGSPYTANNFNKNGGNNNNNRVNNNGANNNNNRVNNNGANNNNNRVNNNGGNNTTGSSYFPSPENSGNNNIPQTSSYFPSPENSGNNNIPQTPPPPTYGSLYHVPPTTTLPDTSLNNVNSERSPLIGSNDGLKCCDGECCDPSDTLFNCSDEWCLLLCCLCYFCDNT